MIARVRELEEENQLLRFKENELLGGRTNMMRNLAELRVENEQLRAALKEIRGIHLKSSSSCEDDVNDMARIARMALGHEEDESP